MKIVTILVYSRACSWFIGDKHAEHFRIMLLPFLIYLVSSNYEDYEVFRSICLSLSSYLCIPVLNHSSLYSFQQSICLSIWYLSIYLLNPSVYQFLHPSIRVCLSVHPSTHSSKHLSIHLSIHSTSIHPSTRHLSVMQPSFHSSIYLSVYPSFSP